MKKSSFLIASLFILFIPINAIADGWEGEDDDLITFLEAAPGGRKVAAVKQAMRGGNLAVDLDDEIDDDDLFDLVDGLLM